MHYLVSVEKPALKVTELLLRKRTLLQKGVKLAKLRHTLLNGATSFHKGFPCFLPLHLWFLLGVLFLL